MRLLVGALFPARLDRFLTLLFSDDRDSVELPFGVLIRPLNLALALFRTLAQSASSSERWVKS